MSCTQNENFALTKEQIKFYIALRKIHDLEENWCDKSDAEIKEIKAILWKGIYRFVKSEVNRMMGAFTSLEEQNDVMQDCALKFLQKLPDYNPLKATPTTYFVRYFKEVIVGYIRKNHTHLSQYDATNSRKIKVAIAEYEQNGVNWGIDMIATKTGLSQKVVKSTLFYASNARMATIEEAESMASNIPTPEDAFRKKEDTYVLYDRILSRTSERELELLMMRFNIDGEKKMPYDKMSEITNLPIRKIKSIINQAICKLNQDDILREQFGERNKYNQSSRLHMQDTASSIMMDQFTDFFSDGGDIAM